jgi:hypothetical protein
MENSFLDDEISVPGLTIYTIEVINKSVEGVLIKFYLENLRFEFNEMKY